MTNPSWGTKRTCPSCAAHFYDLNKTPASCPKCQHSFDPALVRTRRKPTKREAPEDRKMDNVSQMLSAKKSASKQIPDEAGGLNDIAEIEDVDDIESLQELSELEEMEEKPVNEDDADEEALIEDLDAGDKTLVENVEDEEAKALSEEELEESETVRKRPKAKKK